MDIYTLAASIGYTNKIAKKISQEGFEVQVESDRSILESTGEEKTFYFLPKVVSQPQNGFDEYIYTNNSWELVGSTDIDISSKENSENKVDAITSENKSSTTLYPNNKAMTDYVDGKSNVIECDITFAGGGVRITSSTITMTDILKLLSKGIVNIVDTRELNSPKNAIIFSCIKDGNYYHVSGLFVAYSSYDSPATTKIARLYQYAVASYNTLDLNGSFELI